MPKYNFGLNSEAAEAELGGGFYDGPVPPPGVYDFEIKQINVKDNSNGDPRIGLVLEIVAEEGDEKAEYNGAAAFTGLNATDQGAPWVNNFLDACGVDRKKFYSGDVVVSAKNAKGAQDIVKIGGKTIVGKMVRALTKVRQYNGEDQMDIVRYILDGDDDKKPAKSKSKSEPEPDEAATGLEDADDSSEESDDTYTKEELEELTADDLKEILEAWEIEAPAKAKKPALIKLIMEAQASEEDADASDDGDESEEADDSESGGDDLTEDELNEMSSDELKEYITEQGWELPRPPVKSKLVKAVLKYQAEPPF